MQPDNNVKRLVALVERELNIDYQIYQDPVAVGGGSNTLSSDKYYEFCFPCLIHSFFFSFTACLDSEINMYKQYCFKYEYIFQIKPIHTYLF